MKNTNRKLSILSWLCCCLFISPAFAKDEVPAFVKDDVPDVTFDGLQRVQDSKVALAYKHPDADFTGYKKIMLLDAYIAFKKNWQREHRRVSGSEMTRMKNRAADLFRHVFTVVLEEGGYPVVEQAGDDVLLVRAAIIDLDVNAPDTKEARRSRSFNANAGSATLYVELYDSNSGAILARALDRKHARRTSTFRLSSSVYNSSEGRKIIAQWAVILRDRLNEIQGR